ncbi:MAG: hypothetical protein JNL58_31440 [Planctomyces sp.]|nr:hypothetical protein [Planctomyces sp.]
MMTAETFLNAAESVRMGFADRVVSASQVVARRTSRTIVANAGTSVAAQWRAAVASCGGNALKADKAHPGLRSRVIAEANKR